MSSLTKAHAHRVFSAGQRMHAAAKRMREGVEEKAGKIIRTGEVFGGAIAAGVIQGKAGPDGANVFGVPVDLAIGLGLNVGALFDVAGKYSDHLGNVGDGFVAGYGSQLGFSMGTKWRTTGKLFGGTTSAGTIAAGAGGAPKQVAQVSPEAMKALIDARLAELMAAKAPVAEKQAA